MHNSISGLTPFTYFQIIVSLEVTVGVSSHFWGCLYFWGHLHFCHRLHFWGHFQGWGGLHFIGHLHFWGCLYFWNCKFFLTLSLPVQITLFFYLPLLKPGRIGHLYRDALWVSAPHHILSTTAIRGKELWYLLYFQETNPQDSCCKNCYTAAISKQAGAELCQAQVWRQNTAYFF